MSVLKVENHLSIRGSRKFCQKGSNFDNVFLGGRGEEPKPLSVGHHWPASETPFKWRFAGVPLMAQH